MDNPIFFENQLAFRRWLEINHKIEDELIVGFYKVGSGIQCMTWSESVDQALCFGWIDGRTNTIDDKSYQIRFTKRRKNSIWSAVNIKKVEELSKKELMQAAGIEAFGHRKEEKSKIYSFESEASELSYEFIEIFKANSKAWEYFENLAPSYKKVSIHWVMTAKQEETRIKRLKTIIEDSENGTNQWKDNKYAVKKS
jgi:uncharacterized protein YdeI (YjbR/CyaY-like superfamily)